MSHCSNCKDCSVGEKSRLQNAAQTRRSTIDFPATVGIGNASHPAPVYAFAHRNGRLNNDAADAGIRFDGLQASSPSHFSLDSSEIFCGVPGTYLIHYTLFLPRGADIDTLFQLEVNQQTLLPSVLHVEHAADTPGATYASQALLTATSPMVCRLVSGEEIDVRDATATAVATLSLLKID